MKNQDGLKDVAMPTSTAVPPLSLDTLKLNFLENIIFDHKVDMNELRAIVCLLRKVTEEKFSLDKSEIQETEGIPKIFFEKAIRRLSLKNLLVEGPNGYSLNTDFVLSSEEGPARFQ